MEDISLDTYTTKQDSKEVQDTTSVIVKKKSSNGIPFFKGDPRINTAGRPKGKSLKEWVKDKLLNMSEEERHIFLKDVSKDTQWKMAEGNPQMIVDANIDLKVSKLEELQKGILEVLSNEQDKEISK